MFGITINFNLLDTDFKNWEKVFFRSHLWCILSRVHLVNRCDLSYTLEEQKAPEFNVKIMF